MSERGARRGEVRLRVALLAWDTILEERAAPPSVRIGEGFDCLLPVPGTPSTEALRKDEAGWRLVPPPGCEGYLERAGEQRPLAATDLEPGDVGLLRFGSAGLYFDYSAREAAPARRPFWARLDGPLLSGLLAAIGVHFAALIGAFALWDLAPVLNPMAVDDRWVSARFEVPPPPPPEPETAVAEGGEAAPEGEAGTAGDPDEVEPTKRKAQKGRRLKPGRVLARALDDNGVLRDVMTGGQDYKDKLALAMRGHDNETRAGKGSEGLGVWGVKKGGGGPGGDGLWGMNPRGTGIGPGGGRKPPRRRLRPKKPKKRRIIDRKNVSASELCTPGDILKVVQRRSRGISYCYERQLAINPELNGKVTLRWMIDAEGKVARVQVAQDGLRDKQVTGCMKRAVKRWRFAKPQGGGQCVVNFPFVFSPGG